MDRTPDDAPQVRVAQVAERLEGYLRRFDGARDHRAPFAYVYLRLTRSLVTGLAAGTPRFDEPDRVADLAVALAGRYFAAMDALDAWLADAVPHGRVRPEDLPASVPPPWRDVYAASTVPRTYVLEDVLFSMTAHMSYDLPLALLDLRGGSALVPIADFHRMNDLLATTTDTVQDGLAERYWRVLAGIDHLFTRQDELLTSYGVRVARGMAWYNHDRLDDPRSHASALRSIERSTAGLIEQVRHPDDVPRRLALRVARWLVPSRRRWPEPGGVID
jgi:hypothetical protein